MVSGSKFKVMVKADAAVRNVQVVGEGPKGFPGFKSLGSRIGLWCYDESSRPSRTLPQGVGTEHSQVGWHRKCVHYS